MFSWATKSFNRWEVIKLADRIPGYLQMDAAIVIIMDITRAAPRGGVASGYALENIRKNSRTIGKYATMLRI